MDPSRIGQFVAKFMEQLSNEWPEGSKVNDVAIVVDLERPDGEEFVLWACTDRRLWVQQALLEEALDTLDAAREPVDE